MASLLDIVEVGQAVLARRRQELRTALAAGESAQQIAERADSIVDEVIENLNSMAVLILEEK